MAYNLASSLIAAVAGLRLKTYVQERGRIQLKYNPFHRGRV